MLSDKKDISEYLRRREVGFYYRNRRADYQMLAAANSFRIIARKLIAEVKTTDKDAAIQHYADELLQG